jgi:cytochrome c oxidase subunit 2
MILPQEGGDEVAKTPPELAPNGDHGRSNDGNNADDLVARGRALYTSQGCNMCHSTNGAKGIAMSFKGLLGSTQKMQDGSEIVVDDAFVRESILDPYKRITHGYSAMMPSYKGRVNDEEIKALIEFIRSLK